MTIISWCQSFWQENQGLKQRCIDCFLPFFLFEPQENWIPNGRTPNSHLQALQGGHISRPSGPKKLTYIIRPLFILDYFWGSSIQMLFHSQTIQRTKRARTLWEMEKWKYWWQLLLSGEAINNEKTVFEIIIKFAKWICANDPSVPKNFVQRLQGYFKFWQTIFEGPCIQILPIVCTYFSCNSKNKENSHCVRNGSIGDLCYCQAINEKIVRMFKNIDE